MQRFDIADLLEDNPSLKNVLPEALARAYRKAIKEAERETGLLETSCLPVGLRAGDGRGLLAGVIEGTNRVAMSFDAGRSA